MTPPTPITPAMIALQEENEKLKRELAKTKPKKLVPFGRLVFSKRHDYEANLLTYKTDENGQLVTEKNNGGKAGFVFDSELQPVIFSTQQLKLFVEGKINSVLASIEEAE